MKKEVKNACFSEREKKEPHTVPLTLRIIIIGNKLSSMAKKERKEAMIAEAAVDVERLKLGPTPIWTGLVLHYKDVFVSHVLPKLNETDRFFFACVSRESWDLLAYAGVDVSKIGLSVQYSSSISTLEWMWNNMPWGEKDRGRVIDQAWFCAGVVETNKLEFLKWAREVKHCEWDERTINAAAFEGNIEMLKYCFSNDCPYKEKEACAQASGAGHLEDRHLEVFR